MTKSQTTYYPVKVEGLPDTEYRIDITAYIGVDKVVVSIYDPTTNVELPENVSISAKEAYSNGSCIFTGEGTLDEVFLKLSKKICQLNEQVSTEFEKDCPEFLLRNHRRI